MKEGDILRTVCGCNHSFHIKCIERWLEENKKCPQCRQNLVRNTLNDDNDDNYDNYDNYDNDGNDNEDVDNQPQS